MRKCFNYLCHFSVKNNSKIFLCPTEKFSMTRVDSLWPCDAILTTITVWVNIGPGNGLLPDGTKPSPESMLTLSSMDSMAFTWQQFSRQYRKTSNIRRIVVGNKIVDHSDVVGASPVGIAPTTSSFSTWHLASRDSAKTAARQYENLLSVSIWCALYQRLDGTHYINL